jgi:hypothetical protein
LKHRSIILNYVKNQVPGWPKSALVVSGICSHIIINTNSGAPDVRPNFRRICTQLSIFIKQIDKITCQLWCLSVMGKKKYCFVGSSVLSERIHPELSRKSIASSAHLFLLCTRRFAYDLCTTLSIQPSICEERKAETQD